MLALAQSGRDIRWLNRLLVGEAVGFAGEERDEYRSRFGEGEEGVFLQRGVGGETAAGDTSDEGAREEERLSCSQRLVENPDSRRFDDYKGCRIDR